MVKRLVGGVGLGLLFIGMIGCTLFQGKGLEIANWEPTLSPDATMLAFASPGEKGFEIFIRSIVSGDELKRLTHNEVDDWSPCWSPESDRLVFTSSREKNVDLFVIDVTSLEVVRLTTHEGDDINPHWGISGRIFFNSNRSGAWEIYSIDPNGQNLTKITEVLETD